MSERDEINEMDAAEMLERHREEHREEGRTGETEGRVGGAAGDGLAKLVRELDSEARRWHHRQGAKAAGMALVAGATVAACTVALFGGNWRIIVAGIGLGNLAMFGGWMHKALSEMCV